MNWDEILNAKVACLLIIMMLVLDGGCGIFQLSKLGKTQNRVNELKTLVEHNYDDINLKFDSLGNILDYELPTKILIIEKLADGNESDTTDIREWIKQWKD